MWFPSGEKLGLIALVLGEAPISCRWVDRKDVEDITLIAP